MFIKELDTFIAQFKQLWQAGLDAHLAVDAHAGKAWVHLHVQLGQAPGPLHQVQPQFPTHRRNRNGPSRQRRRARRAAARSEQIEETEEVETVENNIRAEEASNKFVNESDNPVATEALKDPVEAAVAGEAIAAGDVSSEVEVTDFECCFCDLDCLNEESLEDHWHEMHRDALELSNAEESEEECNEYKCEVCNTKFKNAGQLRRHTKNNHTRKMSLK